MFEQVLNPRPVMWKSRLVSGDKERTEYMDLQSLLIGLFT